MEMLFNNHVIENVLGVRGRHMETSISMSRISNPAEDGSRIYKTKLDNTEIKVNVLLTPDDISDRLPPVKIALFNRFYTGKSKATLVFDDEPDYFWRGIYSEAKIIKESRDFAEVDVVFECEPWFYARHYTTYHNIDGKEHMNTASNTNGVIAFDLESTHTRLQVTRYGTVARIVLANTDGLAGHWEINMETREVTCDGVLAMAAIEWENTHWVAPQDVIFDIPHGRFRYDFNPHIDATLTFRKRWQA